MNYLYCIASLFFFKFGLSQQNLILNGDFEEYWDCPTDAAQITRCKYVYNPLPNGPIGFSSTPDYFNVCAPVSSPVNVPHTSNGFQFPRSGYGFCGFAVEYYIEFNYNEYIQIELSEELQPFYTYRFSGYFNLGNNDSYTTTNIHFKFIDHYEVYTNFLSDIMVPDYKNTAIIVSDTLGWTEIQFEYQAKGGERYLIVGNFDNEQNTNYVYLYDELITFPATYFYIDDFSLIQVKGPDPVIFPNVFTPNNDSVNDTYKILSGKEQIESFTIVNRWGNVVFESDSALTWDGMDNSGNIVSDGVYFLLAIPKFADKMEKNSYQQVVHLLR